MSIFGWAGMFLLLTTLPLSVCVGSVVACQRHLDQGGTTHICIGKNGRQR